MSVDAVTKLEIEKRAKLFDAAKEGATARIESNFKTAMERLELAKKELLRKAEIEFKRNPFSEFLSREKHTDDEVKSILAQDVPSSFVPSKGAFATLINDIESLCAWPDEVCLNSFELIPQGLKSTVVSFDTISIVWSPVSHKLGHYEVEVVTPSHVNTYHTKEPMYTVRGLEPTTLYRLRVRMVVPNESGRDCLWSDPLFVETDRCFAECAWRECPVPVNRYRKYSVSSKDKRIATKIDNGPEFSTMVGDTLVPPGAVTSWLMKVLDTRENCGGSLFIGVAPYDVDQDADRNHENCGWYFGCYRAALFSGPPHSYSAKPFAKEEKGEGKYVHRGSIVGVTMDTVKGELSFSLDGKDLGVAFEKIPLDKPLVPCVVTPNCGDSVMILASK